MNRMPDRLRILIVEDDLALSGFLTELLRREGYELETADGGREAIIYLINAPVDLILLDINLPDINGYQVMSYIHTEHPDTMVIVMTGDASTESAVEALRKGAYDYLRKPFENTELLATLKNAGDHKTAIVLRKKAEEELKRQNEILEQLVEKRTIKLRRVNKKLKQELEKRLYTEKALKESEEKFRELVELLPEAIFEMDLEGNITFVNQKGLENFAYGHQEFASGLNAFDMLASNERDRVKDKIALSLIGEEIGLEEFTAVRKDGSTFPCLIRAAPIIKAGKAVGLRGFVLDITERKQMENELRRTHDELEQKIKVRTAELQDSNYRLREEIQERAKTEEKLRESEEGFRNLVENSLMGISIIQDDKILYQNKVQDKIYRKIPNKTVYQILEYLHPNDVDKVRAAYKRAVSGEVTAAETDFRFYPSGKIGHQPDMRWVQCRANPYRYRDRAALLINTIDITESKQLEQQLFIKNKMLSLGRVAAGIAHEIRNPLTGINSYLFTLEDICKSDSLEAEDLELMRQILDQIQAASNKIESVIKRVMDFSKPGAPKMVLADINAALEEAIKLSCVTLRKMGIKLEQSLDPDLPRCFADPHLIEQVILNLITNAAKAMEKTTPPRIIEVKSISKNNTLYIGVSDSGPGVPSKLKDKIFEPFFTTKEDGQGIGLNISQRIIADHNGSLSLDTSKWGGAEFRIELPIEKRVNPR
jgi:PAS domain S-box-containing protein